MSIEQPRRHNIEILDYIITINSRQMMLGEYSILNQGLTYIYYITGQQGNRKSKFYEKNECTTRCKKINNCTCFHISLFIINVIYCQ